MRIIFVKIGELSRRYPIVRGMASYTVIWPTACLLQQKISGKEKLDYIHALRFSLYGGFFVGPTLFAWLKIATYLWPKPNLRSAITKALVEQVTYGPAAICCFFFGINLLEFKPISECVEEVKNKFFPTWRIGVFVWPILQTINYVFIPERNRVVYVSFCSLGWTSLLSYVKSLETSQLNSGTVLMKEPQVLVPAVTGTNNNNNNNDNNNNSSKNQTTESTQKKPTSLS
ncbi:protein sym1-like isoform X1 [Cotesia glomerata]|uniref:Mpv17-like protein n=2 Tax=Cotesia glomerata TaxID=32391 RepID=A0AAV7IZK8_COTGL|nr:protein sym1-like isoform X1 [Cotesia glomerata]XP_044584856.1 protein sym1-like isoform X1 [Cotesia glomerata]XP_044584858.1 protein sym1-like isoform X1 [Cotesia glomerata]XP_044584859.1 protein sym1-like isoform X1 [Cotesia glomerata]KAH0561886.1 hypothetical protein KQX54_019961 [Cotesia glomerata]